jgi:septum formation protein
VLVECEESLVFMRSAADEEIYSYIDRYAPYDKAGAYGIQEAAGLFVSRIEGDYSNIVGLPLCRTGLMLKELGVKLF